jgi:predicted RecB family nuclease
MISVTEILKVIDKPALRYWFGQEVFYAMVGNPALNEKEALAAPYQKSRAAMDVGSLVHSIVEAYKTTGQQIDTIPDDYKGYATAFYKFMDEVKPDIIEQEKTVFDKENRVAGTLDMYAKIGDSLYVLDVKTGKGIYPEVELQLSAYAHMLRLDGKKVDNIGVVLLEKGEDGLPTGNYQFAPRTENYDIFLKVKGLYEWINKEKLLKVGYFE